ncbi:MAG TPA: hypothetical protein VKT83_16515 [bacterium]|nr:hypothetical protein [bacterium]
MTPARQIAALAAAAALVAAGFVALGRGAQPAPVAVGVSPGSPGPGSPAAAGAAHEPPARAGQPSTGASDSGDAMDAGDILEPMAAQLADLLEHLRGQCAAARRSGGARLLSAATPCVGAGEAAASTVEFVRGTLASAAGQNVSGSVRSRWTRDLDAAAAEIRSSLTPVQASLGQALGSGAPSPVAVRDLAHLRDRIWRVLAILDQP